jgi:hypothetical protein
MAQRVADDLYREIDAQLSELKRQVRQHSGHSSDLLKLREHLQGAIEGYFEESPLRGSSVGPVYVPYIKKFQAQKHIHTELSPGEDASKIIYRNFSTNSPIDDFINWFWDKEETSVSGRTLQYALLQRNSVSGPVLKRLDNAPEIALAHILALKNQQSYGQKGALSIRHNNYFYARDTRGTLRMVEIFWVGYRSYICAMSIESSKELLKNSRVFFGNALVAMAV